MPEWPTCLSQDAQEEGGADGADGAVELTEIMEGSAASMRAAAAGADGAASVASTAVLAQRSAWWRARLALDARLRRLLARLDRDWLGPWRCGPGHSERS